jgi:hypothetical protein
LKQFGISDYITDIYDVMVMIDEYVRDEVVVDGRLAGVVQPVGGGR